jgi:uncharacterized protein YjbI with pentapeptide repeats
MADPYQLAILMQGVELWNKWREENKDIAVDLSKADLRKQELTDANFQGVDLSNSRLDKAILTGANMNMANLSKASCAGTHLNYASFKGATLTSTYFLNASLSSAKFTGANLCKASFMNAFLPDAELNECELVETDFFNAHLCGTKLTASSLAKANLTNADLTCADFQNADLTEANLFAANCYKTKFLCANLTKAILQNASFVDTELDGASLEGSRIYGLSAWGLKGNPKDQESLIITPDGEAEITVDDIQVAQFIYLLLNNRNLRTVIDTVTSKAVLILGRFTEERKVILDALQAELRKRNYLPILFDFSKPLNRDITETISTLAHLAKFIIADITDAKSIPQELQSIVPDLPSVPVQPILLASQEEYGMFGHFKRYPWVLPTFYYQDAQEVISSLTEHVLSPLETKVKGLTGK